MEERQETPSTLVCDEARCLRWSSKSSDRQIWLSQPENLAQQRASCSTWFDHFYRDSLLAWMLFLQLFWLILRCLWDQLTCHAEGVSKTSSRLSNAPLLGMPGAEHPSLKLDSNYLPEIMLRSGHLHYFHVKACQHYWSLCISHIFSFPRRTGSLQGPSCVPKLLSHIRHSVCAQFGQTLIWHLQLIVWISWGASRGHNFHYNHFQIISQMLLDHRGSRLSWNHAWSYKDGMGWVDEGCTLYSLEPTTSSTFWERLSPHPYPHPHPDLLLLAIVFECKYSQLSPGI